MSEDVGNIIPRPCPFCGGAPTFYNFGRSDYTNGYRGTLGCCADMEYEIPWKEYKSMSEEESEAKTKAALLMQWNQRHEDMHITITVDAT